MRRNHTISRRVTTLALMILLLSPATSWSTDDVDVTSEPVVFWSEGTRLAGDLFYPSTMKMGDQLPGIVLCHGWGGVKEHFVRSYAPAFAKRGYVVLAFDYRGWGGSDGRLLSVEKQPIANQDKSLALEVEVVREVVDPLDQLEDIRNAINFLESNARVDAERIGIWGTSLGGGLAVVTAARDDRVRCVVSQVGVMDGRLVASGYEGGLDAVHADELKRTRGELSAVPESRMVENDRLKGSPDLARFARFSAVRECRDLVVPTLLIDVELEELFDIRDHSSKVYRIIKDNVEAKHKIIPDAHHYDIYRSHYETSVKLGLYWFDKHLKAE